MIHAKRFLFILGLLLLPIVVLAQQPVTTEEPVQPQQQATQIPVVAGTPQNAQPGLPGATPQTLATLGFPTAQPAPGVTPPAGQNPPASTGSTLVLPAVGEGVCPTLVQDAYNATRLTCPNVPGGQACLGNGVIEAAPRADIPGFSFNLPGDMASLTDLSELTLKTISTESRAWTVVTAQFTLSSTDPASLPGNAFAVILGDVAINDDGQQVASGARLATVLATSGINVRRTPDTNGVIVWQLAPSEQITVTGRTVDQQWIRIEIPSQYGGIGWVYAPYLDVQGGAENLPFVTVNSPHPNLSPPEYGPMQAINMLSAITDSACADTPDSGLLLQSPNGLPLEQAVKIRVNDVELAVNGTVFIQAQSGSHLTVTILEGEASVTAAGQTARGGAGSQFRVSLSANLEPQGAPTAGTPDMAKLALLPVSLLPRPFVIGTVAGGADSSGGINTAPSLPTAAAEVCTLRAVETPRNIRSGPGTDFDVVDILRPGETVTATTTARDAAGLAYVWYQTARGFMRYDTVEASAGCQALTGVPLPAVPTAAPAATTAPVVVGTPVPAASLVSSEFGELCGAEPVSASFVFPGETEAAAIGGTWTASAGATAKFGVGGGVIFRAQLGDYIRLVDTTTGALITRSGENRELTFTFQQATTFQFQVIASKGDFVIIIASCVQP